MKTYLYVIQAILSCVIFASCKNTFDERFADIENRIDNLEHLCEQMNTNIASLQVILTSVENRDYITDIVPIKQEDKIVGYTITFAKSNTVTIYNDNKSAIGVLQSNGVYYWMFNGDFILDKSGEKMQISEVTPQFKIENDYWFISVDNGDTWKKLGQAIEDTLFKDIIVNEHDVIFTLSDGEIISVRRIAPLSITFEAKDLIAMDVNSTRDVGYVIESDAETISIEVVNSADIKAKVIKTDEKSGVIRITTSQTIDEYSQVIIFISDESQIIMRSISFEETALMVYNSAFKEISSGGGQIELEFLTNAECFVEIPQEAASWISKTGTKTVGQKSVILNVAKNSGRNREAKVIVHAVESSLELVYSIMQKEDPSFLSQNDREIVIKLAAHFKQDYLIEYWKTVPVKDWPGSDPSIKVNEQGRVIQVLFNGLYGQTYDLEIPDYITELSELEYLYLNNLGVRAIPECIGSLKKLKYLSLSPNEIKEVPKVIKECESLDTLYLGRNKFTEFPREVLQIPHLKLLDLRYNSTMNSTIPEDIGNMTSLEYLNLQGCCLTGQIPKGICDLKNLKYLNLSSGPNDFTKFVEGIPSGIGNLTNLEELYLYNAGLTGAIPESLGKLRKLKGLQLSRNQLSGDIPKSVTQLPIWETNSWNLIWQEFNGPTMAFNPKTLYLPFIKFNTNDMVTNEYINDASILASNKLTLLFNYYSLPTVLDDEIKELYKKYHDQGLGVVLVGRETDMSAINALDIPEAYNVSIDAVNAFSTVTPAAFLFDSEGNYINMMFINFNNIEFVDDIKSVLGEGNGSEIYTSTDYSRDGEVVTYQTATEGEGIDIVFMGDAFVDKDMEENGAYDQAMQYMIDDFFAYEPYKSFKKRFNIYSVKVVSPNSVNAVGAIHRINYSPSVCVEYAKKIPNIDQDRMMVTTYVNYSGGLSYTNMMADGSFFAFIKNKESGVVAHEAGGHGFAGLLDEYVNYSTETAGEEDKTYLDNVWEQYGWGANVDWRNDSEHVKWARLLSDPRYADEGLGVYEGAYLIGYGMYKATEKSMMNLNDTPFNAPSREQIYKRIMQYSEGSGWQYDYEKFVEFDMQTQRQNIAKMRMTPLSQTKEHQRPNMIIKRWQDLK